MAERRMPAVVVITGGTAGVGRAAAREFARQGADVAVIARDRARLDATCEEIREHGRRAIGISADVADAAAVDAAAAQVERDLGPIDCWVNNAMTSVFATFMDISAEEFHRVLEVTFLGAVHGSHAALRYMMPRNAGTIIQVGSALAYRGIPLQSAYCASKHAIVGLTDSLRSELMHDGYNIRVSMVHLPAMNTPQFDWVLSRLDHRAQPVPPIFTPEVAARAIAWCGRHPRRELVVGFPTFKTKWGNRLAPRYVDRVLARMGFSSQQTDEFEPPDRPSNLWAPVEGDFEARGRFSARSRSRSWWTEVGMRPGVFLAGALVVFAFILAFFWWAIMAEWFGMS